MARLTNRHSKKAGLPPGSVIYVGEKKLQSVRITLMDYDAENFRQEQVADVEKCFELKATPTVTWINIDGLHDTALIEKIGSRFSLHPLVMEDIVNTGQRPKFEDYDDYLFVVFRMLTYDESSKTIQSEQVSLVLGDNYVISFQERVGDVFEHVRERINSSKGRIRKAGCDYLAYSLMDAVVDNYFAVLEKIGDHIELLEEELMDDPDERTLRKIYNLKGEMLHLRKSVWPLREVLNGMGKKESELISEATSVYLSDVYDHTIQIIDTIESLRDTVSGMLDIYLSNLSNRMNAIMKVLTIIATIFIPLTFIAGVYGMNFEYMPELKWAWAYPAVLLVMLGVAVVMLIYFRRKKWL